MIASLCLTRHGLSGRFGAQEVSKVVVEKAAGSYGRAPGGAGLVPVPTNKEDVPYLLELTHDDKQHYYIVRWHKAVLFSSGERKSSLWFSVGLYGSEPAALTAAWR